jgi:GNAT superfamily N-acetyltransferase
MGEIFNVNGNKYIFINDYKDNDILRNSFNNLTRNTYGFDFEDWYQKGYWQDKYMPYSIADGDIIVANVSVNIMDFFVMGESKRYIQLGTVMTNESYRNLGFSRILIQRILDEWENKCDLIYLFANDSVINFYPKFGFLPNNQYQCSKKISKKSYSFKARKLDMLNIIDREFLYYKVNETLPFANITMKNNPSLVMFYCISFMAESVYYIEAYDAIVIADFEEDILYLQDIFSTKDIDVDKIIDSIINVNTKRVVFGFTPCNVDSIEVNLLKEEDTTLFIRSSKENPFSDNKLMFPILSHA